MNTTMAPRVHPAGEGVSEFPTTGGKVRLQSTDDVLTPYGGLVPWVAFARHTGIFERLSEACPVLRTSPNSAPVYDVVQSFALTALNLDSAVEEVVHARTGADGPAVSSGASSPSSRMNPISSC